jgi:putative lipase involved disintegration of autophagic bodies
MWEKTAERLYQRDDTINVLQRYLKDVLRTDDDDLNREILEAWDVFNRSGTLVELMKYSSKGYEAIKFLELWQEVAGHWSVCPVCAIGEGKAGERGRLPETRRRRTRSGLVSILKRCIGV